MAVESCRVECEGSGVRFFCECLSIIWARILTDFSALLPGTIANGFRLKHAVNESGGRDETTLPIRHAWEKLLLKPEDGRSAVTEPSSTD